MPDHWNAELYDTQHAFVARYGEDVLEILAPQKSEHVLDLGCGTGSLTHKIAQSGARVVGLDASSEMLRQARQSFPEIEFVLADATQFSLGESFDAVFTNAVLHWILEPHKAFECVAKHLKSGGRFVGEFGGSKNVARMHDALRTSAQKLDLPIFEPHKFFPSIGVFAPLFEEAGFELQFAHLFERHTPLEGEEGAKNWFRQFCATYLDSLPKAQREALLDEAQEALRSTNRNQNGWFADYRRLRFLAIKN